MSRNSKMKQDDLKEQCMKLHIAFSIGDSRNINTMDPFPDCMVLWEIISEDEGCTNRRCPVPWLTKLYMMATSIFNIITALFSLHAKMCITTHAPSRKCQGALSHGSLQNCGCLVWNLLHVSPLARNLEVAPRFLGSLWTPAKDTDTAAQGFQQKSS